MKKLIWILFAGLIFNTQAEWKSEKVLGDRATKLKNKYFTIQDEKGFIKTEAPDGTIFVKKPFANVATTVPQDSVKKHTGYQEPLVRIVDGKEEVLRDFVKESSIGPDSPYLSMRFLDMAAVEKDEEVGLDFICCYFF